MTLLPEKPEDSKTVAAIYAYHESKRESSPRSYLGASQIGHACDRHLWYSFRHCGTPEFSGRMLRLFETGDLAEHRFVAELKAIGCEVYDVDPNTGEQWEVHDIGGHFSGHMDGAGRGIPEAEKAWHVLEFKTHNAKSFKSLKIKGVKESKPLHYSQMAVYMKLTGMKRALYLAVNKDTDELYSERLRWEEVSHDADRLMERAERIIKSSSPPDRISDGADYFECRWCDYRNLCHGLGESAAVPCTVGCRTCVSATPDTETGGGRWACERHNITLTVENQRVGCEDHLFIPGLVTFATPEDADHDGIDYRNADGTTWRNAKDGGNYTSKELTELPAELVGAGVVADVKEVFGEMDIETVKVSKA